MGCECKTGCTAMAFLVPPSDHINPEGRKKPGDLDVAGYERLCNRIEVTAKREDCRLIADVRAQIKVYKQEAVQLAAHRLNKDYPAS